MPDGNRVVMEAMPDQPWRKDWYAVYSQDGTPAGRFTDATAFPSLSYSDPALRTVYRGGVAPITDVIQMRGDDPEGFADWGAIAVTGLLAVPVTVILLLLLPVYLVLWAFRMRHGRTV